MAFFFGLHTENKLKQSADILYQKSKVKARRMEFAPDDVIEQILLRLDVKDLIRCKSVCNFWYRTISSPYFVKAHLKHAYAKDHNDPELGHRRICILSILNEECWHTLNKVSIVGSCDGLLCISPRGVKLALTNPLTREHKKLPTPPYRLHQIDNTSTIRDHICWGFGYDSSADDYKVIAGFTETNQAGSKETHFYSLTLKSNTWKFIGHVKYWRSFRGLAGILCGGSLHWVMTYKKDEGAKKEEVIISLDISTEEFKETHLPSASTLTYTFNFYLLGVIEECLCIYTSGGSPCTKKWVMKNNKWELFINDHCQSKYDVAHNLPIEAYESMYSSDYVDDGIRVPVSGIHVRACIFVKSLVSPHFLVNDNNNHYEGQKRIVKEDTESVERDTTGDIKKRKRNQWGWWFISICKAFKTLRLGGLRFKSSYDKKKSKRSCKHKKASCLDVTGS